MRMVGAGMTAAVLLMGLAASAASAQDTDGDLHSASPKPKAWWDGWYGPAAKPPDKKHDDAEPPPHGPSPVELADAARQQERAAWNRRNMVLDRLQDVADRTNDEAMRTQIEQLRDRAWDVYQQRIAAMSGPSDEKPDFGARSPRREVRP